MADLEAMDQLDVELAELPEPLPDSTSTLRGVAAAPAAADGDDEMPTLDFPQPNGDGTLRVIWEAEQCMSVTIDGKAGWECGHCGFRRKERHHSRALRHFAKIRNGGISICKAAHPPEARRQYLELYNSHVARLDMRQRINDIQREFVESRQDAAGHALSRKRLKLSGTSGADSYSPVARASSRNTSPAGQASINASLQNLNQQDIRVSNNSSLEMAIADFFHSENIPDRAASSKRFALVLKKARLVGDDFKPPGRNRIGGELLDLNYDTCMASNKELLLKEAPTFGMAWIGDGATVKRMPLVNVLAMCGEVPPTVVAINDCTDHMAEGGKKDATYISEMFETEVAKYDPNKLHSDIFFFDGASNVQKAGEILTKKHPRAFCCHGGEHVLSLFFEDLAKIPVVKVRRCRGDLPMRF